MVKPSPPQPTILQLGRGAWLAEILLEFGVNLEVQGT